MAATGHPGCLFCRILAGGVHSRAVEVPEEFRDDLYAFEDIQPRAPTHILVIPREHIATVNDLEPRHAPVVGRLVLAAAAIAKARGIAGDGYRLVLNTNLAAGQSVFHIHLHLLGGRSLGWPPG